MANVTEKFKEKKNELLIKIEKLNDMADAVSKELADSLRDIAKDASDDDLVEFLLSDDEAIESRDRVAMILAFTEAHNIEGGFPLIQIIGKRKS